MSEINTWPGWECVRLIGSGSYGKVYEIKKNEYGKTYSAALKVITIPQNKAEINNAFDEGMDKESVTNYFRSFVDKIADEVALMYDLKGYTNIVSYQDHKVIEHEDEIRWDILIRMELLIPLQTYCNQKKLTEKEILKLGCDICRALELCWKTKIIHRDIKPANIFINKYGDFELGDFGIARTVENELTTGSFAGTETYMAPEVYMGRQYGHKADIYSLSLVLYRYLNQNRMPFLPFGNLLAGDIEQAKKNRMNGEPIPAPVNGSRELKKVVLKALSYNPDNRFQTAAEFRIALENCCKNNSVDNENSFTNVNIAENDEKTSKISWDDSVKLDKERSLLNEKHKTKDETDIPRSTTVSESRTTNKRNKILNSSVLGIIFILLAIVIFIKYHDFLAMRLVGILTGGASLILIKFSKSSVTDVEWNTPYTENSCIVASNSDIISVGETMQLYLKNGGYIYRSVDALLWESDNTDVVTVDASGTVTGISSGIAMITGTCDSVKATIGITVVEGKEAR